MSFPNKMKVNVAVSNNNKFDLSHNTLFSQDFGTMDVVECRYMVPGDSFDYQISKLTRALPMPSPTFGKITEVTRAFFVPMRSIKHDFLDFISNQNYPSEASFVSTKIPTFKLSALFSCLEETNVLIESDTIADYYDFRTQKYYKVSSLPYGDYDGEAPQQFDVNLFRGYAKDVLRLLDCLGYKFPKSLTTRNQNTEYSVLPLLACQKFYYDWVVPSRFLGNEWHFSRIQGYINKNTTTYTSGDSSLNELLAPLVSFFADDYITGCEQYPYQSPNDLAHGFTAFNQNSFLNVNIPVEPNAGINGAYLTSFTPDDTSNYRNFNYYSLQSLGKIQDYLNRGMIAGTKVKDFLKTEFGITPSTDALNISSYLGKFENVIEIGAITSQADTLDNGGLALGQYAGKALGSGDGNFSVRAKEHGFVVITHEIIPETNYYQGLNPHCLMLDALDFFQPEFDNLGFEPVPMRMLDGTTYGSPSDTIFGFQPRYAHLKFSNDVLAGDFVSGISRNTLNSWYMNREIDNINGSTAISPSYCIVASPRYVHMDKIFNYSNIEVDHFYNIFRVNCKASRPMASITEALDPDHPNGNKDVTVNKHGAID